MAKISARGAVKLAEATMDEESSDWPGGVARTFYVLRSDGTILRASSFPNHPGGSYDRKRTAYTVMGKLKACTTAEKHEAFARYIARKGAVLS